MIMHEMFDTHVLMTGTRITQFRREPTRDVDQYDGRRDGDSVSTLTAE